MYYSMYYLVHIFIYIYTHIYTHIYIVCMYVHSYQQNGVMMSWCMKFERKPIYQYEGQSVGYATPLACVKLDDCLMQCVMDSSSQYIVGYSCTLTLLTRIIRVKLTYSNLLIVTYYLQSLTCTYLPVLTYLLVLYGGTRSYYV